MAGIAPKLRAAMPAKKSLRAGLAGAHKPSQHMQRDNLRRVGLALIPASRLSDLSGCWSLLLGSSSMHRPIGERAGRECNVAIRDQGT